VRIALASRTALVRARNDPNRPTSRPATQVGLSDPMSDWMLNPIDRRIKLLKG